MKRRDFVLRAAAMCGSLPLARASLGQERPCPPGPFGVEGGTNSGLGDCGTEQDLSGPLGLPLYDTSKMSYLGSFLLPETGGSIGADGHTGFQYSPGQGGAGIAYNPASNSLFIQGSSVNNDTVNFIMAEVTIPTPKTSGYDRASLLQDWAFVCGTKGRVSSILGGTGDAGNGITCTGMMVHNGEIITTHGGLYSNNPTPYGAFVRDTDLSNTTVRGPYAISSLNQRIVCNGIGGFLPNDWQSTFGGAKAVIGGGGGLSTMNNACFGPGFHFYNPSDLTGTGQTVKPGKNACYFTGIGDSGYSLQDNAASVWNGMSLHRGTVFLPESRTVLAYGFGGSDSFYDTGGVITGGVQGTYASGGTPKDRFWLYDARDLKDAFDGRTNALNNVRPYATFDMDFSYRNNNDTWIGETENMRSLTWDEANRTAYILETRGGGNSFPIVHVVRIAA